MFYMSMNVYHNVLNWDTKTINFPFGQTENNGLGFPIFNHIRCNGRPKTVNFPFVKMENL